MWQKCPICDGEGRVTSNGLSSSVHQVCSVCKGAKIISELNGLPPNSIDKDQQKKLLIEIMELDEKDGLYDHIGDTNKMVTMKLYTEEQVRGAMQEARYAFSTDKGYDEIVQSLTPIELPSDEEIIKNAPNTPKNADDYLISNKIGFVQGAKWIKKQILNQNK